MKCTEPNCTYPKGACLNNLGERCPNLHPDDGEAPVVETVVPKPPAFESLHSGDKLLPAEAAGILRSTKPIVVVVAGLKDSGKTTFLARIHEYFHEGPLGNFNFTWSKTLMGFGLLSWNAMMQSRRAVADTERTKTIENDSFLHFRVRRRPDENPIELLINDIAGETFRDAASLQTTCESLIPLTRADHIVMLLDGEIMGRLGERDVQIAACRDFLKMACQCGSIGSKTIVHIVLSKTDTATEATKEYARRKQQQLQKEFAPKLGRVVLWEIACRPPGKETPDAIRNLFHSWFERIENAPAAPIQAQAQAARDMCNFGRFSQNL